MTGLNGLLDFRAAHDKTQSKALTKVCSDHSFTAHELCRPESHLSAQPVREEQLHTPALLLQQSQTSQKLHMGLT